MSDQIMRQASASLSTDRDSTTGTHGESPPASLLQQIDTLTDGQRLWLSGYLAGLGRTEPQSRTDALPQSAIQTNIPVMILVASQTGNGEQLADQLARSLNDASIPHRIERIDRIRPRQLASHQQLILIASTHGEGEPPDDALSFIGELDGPVRADLSQLSYHVIGLGDRSYEHFCKTARDLDAGLARWGAQRIGDREELDVDYAEKTPEVIEALRDTLERHHSVAQANVTELPLARTLSAVSRDSRQPLAAELMVSQKITGRDSARIIQHLELATLGLEHQPGDSVAVHHHNDSALVQSILDAVGLDGETPLASGQSLAGHLVESCELTLLTPDALKQWSSLHDDAELARLACADRHTQQGWLVEHQWIDLFEQWPARPDLDHFVSLFKALTPRLYSIASSSLEYPDEVHLTVALKTSGENEQRKGSASQMLIHELQAGDSLTLALKPNRHFRLPEDPNTDVIMIGPGTGIAPFRAFMQHRQTLARGGQAVGRDWLFFGNRHARSEFLYQTEWLDWHQSGALNRLSVAFSRDLTDDEPRYVQDCIADEATELLDWLDQGAHLYVCGATRMSTDVLVMLERILTEHRGLSAEQASQQLHRMKLDRRLQLDVY